MNLRGQPTNRKGKPGRDNEHVGKGANWEAVYQSVSPKTWMIWVKLYCLKSSGKLETSPSLDTTAEVEPWWQHLVGRELRNPPARNKGQ